MTDTDRWVPMAGVERVTYDAPTTDGGSVRETLVASSVTLRDGRLLGDILIATAQSDGAVHIISQELIVKRETAQQNLKYGGVRWRAIPSN
jgi:hypothetical protein